jgi:hypothetical protein
MVDVYELAARLFARDFEGVSESKAREEAQWAIRAAEVFVGECLANEAAKKKPPAIVRRGLS